MTGEECRLRERLDTAEQLLAQRQEEIIAWRLDLEAARQAISAMRPSITYYPAVGSAWSELDTRISATVIHIIEGAERSILLQLDGKVRDCTSRRSVNVKEFYACWVPL